MIDSMWADLGGQWRPCATCGLVDFHKAACAACAAWINADPPAWSAPQIRDFVKSNTDSRALSANCPVYIHHGRRRPSPGMI